MKRLALGFVVRLLLVPVLSCGLAIVILGRRMRPVVPSRTARQSGNASKLRVAVLATFYNANWCRSHLAPLGLAPNIKAVTAVVDGPTAHIDGITYVVPSDRLRKSVGRVLAKLLLLFRVVRDEQSDVVVGYFLVPNGLSALMVASLLGCRAIYQNTVGSTEIAGGGYLTDNWILQRLGWRSWILERLLFAIVRRFDAVIVRGPTGVEYLQAMQLTRRPLALPGSVDCHRFAPSDAERPYDLITVCRLVEVKQLHHLLRVVRRLRERRGAVSALIVGDGPLLAELKAEARCLGVERDVCFAGQNSDVELFLRRAKLFVLTSRMEGLSIALAEAMASGLPAVVTDVGELSTLVKDGVNGWRIPFCDVEMFSQRISELLDSPADWARFSDSARQQAVHNNGLANVTARWATLLDDVCGSTPIGAVREHAARPLRPT